MEKKYDIYGIGSALVDTEVRVQDDFLEAMGIRKGWMVEIDEARRRELAALLQAGAASRFCGGSAANTVIAANHFGARAFFSCRTADDDDGDFFRRSLHESGVRHNGACEAAEPPANAL